MCLRSSLKKSSAMRPKRRRSINLLLSDFALLVWYSVCILADVMLRESLQRAAFLFRVLTRRKLDLLDQLEADHLRIEFLFFQWRFARARMRREEILNTLQRELLLHFQLKESVFYPACEKIPELRE